MAELIKCTDGGYNVDPDLLASATNRAQTIYFFT